MSVPTAYLTSTKNTASILSAIQKAAVPETFTYEFLKQLGYASSSDRPTLSVLKSVGLLDSGGRPTPQYREYKDAALSKQVLAAGLRSAYKDLFAIDTDAHLRSISELNGMFARLSDKGSSVTQKMASTFKVLADLADFSSAPPASQGEPRTTLSDEPASIDSTPAPAAPNAPATGAHISLRHDIHVHLPLSTDVAVYDAIFKSLKANLT
jgi:hypothetical protein